MGWASGFSAGSQLGRSVVDTYRQSKDYQDKERRKQEIADVAGARGTEAYTAEQAAQLEAAAQAIGPDGKPYYTVGNDATGKYTLTPNFQNETGATPTDYAPATVAAKGVNFLGKNYDAPLTEGQALGARQQAIAGVMEKHGDTEGAMRYRQQAQQGELTTMQIAQAKRTGAREDKMDANTAIMEGVDKDTGARDLARRTGPDGVVRDMTLDDHLHNSQVRASLLTQAGKINEAGQAIKEFNAQSFAKIQLDTAQRDQDLGRAASALGNGDTGGIKDFYNKHVPDGAHVTNVVDDGKGNITIERTTADGRPLPPVTKNRNEILAGLNSFKDPMALYNWSQNEFKNNLALNADTRAGEALKINQAQLGIQQAQLGLSQQNAADGRSDKSALRTAGAAYELARQNGNEAGMKAATLDLIKAGGTAPGGANANDPAEVKLANAYIRAGLASNLAEGLQLATSSKDSSPDRVRAEIFGKALAAKNGNATQAQKATEEAMAYLLPGGAKPSRSASGKVTGQPSTAASPTKGSEQVVSAGANKGKTAVFDGTGWVLKP